MTRIHAGAPPPTTLALLLHDGPTTLDRVLGAVRRQGCRIVSLAYGPSERAGITRTTLTVSGGNPARLAQQLGRIVAVVAATQVDAAAAVHRETALVRVDTTRGEAGGTRAGVSALASRFGARVAESTAGSLLLEITDDPARVEEFITAVRTFDVRELVRAGRVAAGRAPLAGAAAPSPFHFQADGMSELDDAARQAPSED